MENTQKPSMGLGLILTIIFIILKLTDNIDWSWVWILSPLWVPSTISFCIAMVFLSLMLIGYIINKNK